MRRRRSARRARRLPLALVVLLVAFFGVACFALANAILGVTPPRLGQNASAINPAALQPLTCRDFGLNPTHLDADDNGTTGSDLILGSNAGNNITGRGGNDCILGGGGNDTIDGGGGANDVCIGGTGTDTFNRCEHRIDP